MPEPQYAHIVLAADGKYAPGAWVAIRSSFLHWSGEQTPQFHLLTMNAGDPAVVRLAACAKNTGVPVEIHEVDVAALEGLNDQRFGYTAFFRIFAPHLLPEVTEMLYLDSDVLVRSSLHPLFQTGSPAIAAGVPEFGIKNLGAALHYLSLGETEANWNYFNSGILRINVPEWTKNQITRQVLEFVRQHQAHLAGPDQEGINYALRGRLEELDFSWNFQVGAFEYLDQIGWTKERDSLAARRADLLADAKIVHYIYNPNKPWQTYSLDAYSNEYRKVFLSSGWLDFRERLRLRFFWSLRAMHLGARRLKRYLLGLVGKRP